MDLVQELTDGGRIPVPDIIEIPSLTEFLKRIGKNDSGYCTNRLKESIRRLAYTTCVTERAFNCPTDGGYLSLIKPLRLIEECAFRGTSNNKGGVHECTWIRLGEFVKKNLESGYIALLDVRFIQSLNSELAKQLYSYLSYRFWLAIQHGRDYSSEHWKILADYLAASGWQNLTRAKQRLSSAISELKRTNYIDEASDWNGDTFVFKLGERFIDELRNRMKAREQYQQWIEGKRHCKQLTVVPRPRLTGTEITAEDQRESVVVRQAMRLKFLRQMPDTELLAKHGWTLQDVESLASRMSEGAKQATVDRRQIIDSPLNHRRSTAELP
jgi:hypothetical protein